MVGETRVVRRAVVPLLTPTGVVAESTPAPVSCTVTTKKSKSGSSAEEEDKEIFVLQVC